MNMLERMIWKSSIRLETRLRFYQTYIVPVLMYGCETWATTKYLLSRLDAFDTWALCKILRIPYTRHVSNAEVRRTTGCSLLSHLVTNRCLRLFGYNCSQFTSRGPPSSPCSVYTRQDRPTGSDQQEDPATLGCVQLRQTLAL